MCSGFGCIVDKELNLYFSEPDHGGDCSHSKILNRLGWKDNDSQFVREFVRVEFSDWTTKSFSFDEDTSLPGWAEESQEEIKSKCIRLLKKCKAAYAEYAKVRDVAWSEYEKVRDVALPEYEKVCDAACAEYEKVCDATRAEYEKVRDVAYTEYEKVHVAAYTEYEKVRDVAYTEYEKVRDVAWSEYEKVRDAAYAEMIAKLSEISGYVPQKESESNGNS